MGNIITNNIPWAEKQLLGTSAGIAFEGELKAVATEYINTNGAEQLDGLEAELTAKADQLLPLAVQHLPIWAQAIATELLMPLVPHIVNDIVQSAAAEVIHTLLGSGAVVQQAAPATS